MPNDYHQLFLVSNPDDLDLRKELLGDTTMLVSHANALCQKAVFKYKTTISEVFGYSFARLLSVPVADFLGLRFDREVKIPGGHNASRNDIAILIALLPIARPLRLEDLALLDKRLAARVLTLCFFDRHEWPEVFMSGGSIVVLDLECIGPVMLIEDFTSGLAGKIRDALLYRENQYVCGTGSSLKEVIATAKELQILKQFREEIRKQGCISAESLNRGLLFTGHPCSRLLSAFFQSAISRRQAICARTMGTFSWTVPNWEMLIGKE